MSYPVPVIAVLACILACGCGRSDLEDSPPPGDAASPIAVDAAAAQQAALAARPDDWFEDVTQQSGVDFIYVSGREAKAFTILETVGGGAALFDMDQDGDLDLFLPGGGKILPEEKKAVGLPCRLYRNAGDGRFEDVTAGSGLDVAIDYSHGASVADFNRDNRPDLLVTCFGRSRLFANKGDGKFKDVTQTAGLQVDGWSTAAAWADLDQDGFVEPFIAAYLDWTMSDNINCMDRSGQPDVCPPSGFLEAADRLFHNRGDGTFQEITQAAKIKTDGKGLGVVAANLDGDQWIDLYVANDAGPNHFYRGGPNLQFTEEGVAAGVAHNEFGAAEGSMGVDVGDFNGDGQIDLWTTNYEMEDNSLYASQGDALYMHRTVVAGLGGQGRPYVAFGTGFADFNTDGWLDLFILNGNVLYTSGQSPYRQPSLLLVNQDGRFQNVSEQASPYFRSSHVARGAALGDIDNDGALDLVIVHQDEPVVVLRNRQPPSRWFRVSLRGVKSNTDAIGAVVETTHQGRRLVRPVTSGSGYLSHFDPRIIFPLVEGQEPMARVRWPNGDVEKFVGLTAQQTNTLVEGEGQAIEPDESP